jgi:hypothetical protein
MPEQDDIPRMRDELVEAFFAGETARVTELGRAILAESLEDGYGLPFSVEVDSGTLPEFDQVSDDSADLWMLAGHVAPECLGAPEDGERLTPDELAPAPDLRVRNAFKEYPDRDIYALWQNCAAEHDRDGHRPRTSSHPAPHGTPPRRMAAHRPV